MLEIQNAVAVITGGGSGIGEALAKDWVRSGGKVVLADVVVEDLNRVEQEIKDMGGDVVSLVCDVTKEEDNHALAMLAVERFGAINLIVPCAGIARDSYTLVIDKKTGQVTGKMSLQQFQSVIDVNLTGVFLTVRECAEQMINSGSQGLICVISSTSSLGTAGHLNYAASKAAMSVFPKVLTAEFFRRKVADQVRCVAVAPGYVATPLVRNIEPGILDLIVDQVPIRRLIEPNEVTSLIMALYQNEACAGEVYFVHGGLRLGSRG